MLPLSITLMPAWLKRSIALKVIASVGSSIAIIIAAQTYINVLQVSNKMESQAIKHLYHSLDHSETMLAAIHQQTKTDAEIIGSHNALANYLDYAALKDKEGMNEEVVEIEQFLRSLVKSQQKYRDIEIFVDNKSIIHLKNRQIAKGSQYDLKPANRETKESSLTSSFSNIDNEIFLDISYSIAKKSDFNDEDSHLVAVSIRKSVSDQLNLLFDYLKNRSIHLCIISSDQLIIGDKTILLDEKAWLTERITNEKNELEIVVKIKKQDAFLFAYIMRNQAIFLALLVILSISILLFLIAKLTIDKPLSDIINFIREDVLNKNNLALRYKTSRIDEIGVFSQGLNNVLDQVQQREEALRYSEERLMLALWGGGEGMWDFNVDKKILYLDKRGCEILGIDIRENHLPISQFRDYVHPDDRNVFKQYVNSFLDNDSLEFELDIRFITDSQDIVFLQIKGKPIAGGEKKGHSRITGTIRDITLEKKSEEEIKLYATAFQSTNNAAAILDKNFIVLAINKAYNVMTGFGNDDVVGNEASFIGGAKGTLLNVDNINRDITSNGFWTGERIDKRKNNESYLQEIVINPVVGNENTITHYVCVFSDVTDQKKYEKKLWKMANYDTLTSLPNRAMFRESLDESLIKAEHSKKLVGLLFVDLDRFKQVNDTLGHDAGDGLLQEVAARLSGVVRQNDMVARLGGDEFAIILEGVPDKENIEKIANKVIKAFEEGFFIKGRDADIGVSIGISLFSLGCQRRGNFTVPGRYGNVLFQKKLNVINSVFYVPSMSDETGRRNYLRQELKKKP